MNCNPVNAASTTPQWNQTAPSDAPMAACPTLLPEPANLGLSGGSIAALAAFLTEADIQDRTHARELEQLEDSAALQSDEARVRELQQKADNDATSGLVSGLCELAGGGLAVGGAFASGSAGTSSTDELGNAAPYGLAGAGGQGGFASGRALFEGSGEAVKALGSIAGSQFKAASEGDEARADGLDAQAQAKVRRFGEAHDAAQAAADALEKVRQLLDACQQAQNAARLAAASARA